MDKKGKKSTHEIRDSGAATVFSTPEKVADNGTLLEAYVINLPNEMKYIPFSLKGADPELFGRLLYNSYKSTEKMRNIGVAGISPEMMDFGGMTIEGESTSLLEKLHHIPGVSRVDLHRQTAALGKWHILVKDEEY